MGTCISREPMRTAPSVIMAAGLSKSFVQVTTDSLGNPFTSVNYLAMGSAIFSGGQGYGACIFAIKDDGTLWVWGNTQGGYRGDGTYGQVNTKPVQVPFPAGTKITKAYLQNIRSHWMRMVMSGPGQVMVPAIVCWAITPRYAIYDAGESVFAGSRQGYRWRRSLVVCVATERQPVRMGSL